MLGPDYLNFKYDILSTPWPMPSTQAEKSSKLLYLSHNSYLYLQKPFNLADF